jgi:hypothetical protein
MHLVYRKTCRICGSAALKPVIDLGEQHLQGSFVKPGKEMPPIRKIPTTLVRCDPTQDEKACGLLQTSISVPPEILYSSYWYRSGTNQTMRNHLKGIADAAVRLLNVDCAVVLDIGCNDGTLLNCYPETFVKFGVDPSDVAHEVGNDVDVVQDIFPSSELKAKLGGSKVDAITSIAMFYDLEEPCHFVEQIKEILADDGIWILEMSYMPSMLSMNSYDTICHEHLEYYSLTVVENLLARCDMKVVNVELNDINGGSIRCYATHEDSFKYKNPVHQNFIKDLRQSEFDLELDTDKPYDNFQEEIESHREQLSTLVRDLKRQGKVIHLYGASTKGNTILQWCGFDSTVIDCAAERNPDKFGARTIGTDIPIVSEEESRAMNPDYYLVLPWHFRKEFLVREEKALAAGTKFIFPLPNVEIVGG